ncbi:hypothetical protein DV096_10995 [Bradymonadaceae bacterium TMQ3]|nr:hypothetical protein DV096_10995 [Bradymonadaceae bacterium TMQ3]
MKSSADDFHFFKARHIYKATIIRQLEPGLIFSTNFANLPDVRKRAEIFELRITLKIRSILENFKTGQGFNYFEFWILFNEKTSHRINTVEEINNFNIPQRLHPKTRHFLNKTEPLKGRQAFHSRKM